MTEHLDRAEAFYLGFLGADAILTVVSSMLGSDPRSHGLTSGRLGIQGVDSAGELLEIVGVGS